MTERPVYTLETLPELVGSFPLYGVMGFPIAHSRSPAMQMVAFNLRRLPARYVRIEAAPEQFVATVEMMKQLRFRGWNCTIPHKFAMRDLVQYLDTSAVRAKAVNTVKNLDGTLTGFSTDGAGWVRAVRECFRRETRDLRVLLLGAGGSGQTLAREAIFLRCPRLVIANRSWDKAQELVESLQGSPNRTEIKAIPWEDDALQAELRQTDLLVNTTSVGLKPEDPPVISPHLFSPGLMVYDLVYQKAATPLVAAARQAGLPAADGLSMLLYQGAEAFSLWTGYPAPIEAMRHALI